jgi:hypothetical protein
MITFTDDELDDIFELVKKEYEKVKTEHMSVEPFHITPEDPDDKWDVIGHIDRLKTKMAKCSKILIKIDRIRMDKDE